MKLLENLLGTKNAMYMCITHTTKGLNMTNTERLSITRNTNSKLIHRALEQDSLDYEEVYYILLGDWPSNDFAIDFTILAEMVNKDVLNKIHTLYVKKRISLQLAAGKPA